MNSHSIHAPFNTTQWSLIGTAQAHENPDCSRALEKLCADYWLPLYSFIRRQGYSPHDAQDHTQAFFQLILSGSLLPSADQAKGKFRSYLLAACQHFLSNQRDYDRAQKRGGHLLHVSLDVDDLEARMQAQDSQDTEVAFDREWANALLVRVFSRLQEQYTLENKEKIYATLEPLLLAAKEEIDADHAARSLEVRVDYLHVLLHRLRQRFRQVLRAEVMATLSDPTEVEDEIRHLILAIRHG